MQKINRIFKNYNLIVFILIAFIFSIACRFYWIFWASEFNEYFFNNELMIISNDGYAFAEGARDMIAGFHQPNDLSYYGSSLSTLTYWLYKITPFSFEGIILYMSVFLSSLLVIPLVLIANEYKNPLMGFIAALLASIANSYYNRTMAGYYDTDMLVIVLPMFILFFMIRLILKKDLLSFIFLPFCVMIYLWWYPSSYTLNVALIGLFLIYTLIFHRKETILYMSIILMLITLSNIAWFYQSAIIVILFSLFVLKNYYFNLKLLLILGFFTLIFLILSGGVDPILYQLKFYIFRTDSSANLTQGFVYFNVNKTIQEVESIDLSVFMQRISSNEIIFLLSFIGFILFIKQHKSVILALPMLLLGFLALKGGLRFTIYAVPIMALGFGFLCIKFLEYLEKIKIQNIKDIRFFRFLLIIIFLFIVLFIFFYLIQKNFDSYDFLGYFAFLLILFFFIFMALKFLYKKNLKLMRVFLIIAILMISLSSALRHIYNYKAPTVFTQNEAILLTKLKELASREDYVVTWWDYGYPIRYYSDVKTLVDGGKHLGKDNFFPSFVLSKDQRSAANMARLSVEYTEKSFYKPYNDLLDAMMRDYNQSNVDLFLNSLSKENFKINTPKTRDIYLYLPSRMVSIFLTVASFSFIDLETGELNKPFTFSTSYILGENNGEIILSNGIILSNDFRNFKLNGDVFAINSFIEFDSVEKNEYKIINVDPNANFYIFYIKDSSMPFTQFILMDKNMYQSAFVQMFFLGNYDKNLFDLVLNTKEAKVFKLKI